MHRRRCFSLLLTHPSPRSETAQSPFGLNLMIMPTGYLEIINEPAAADVRPIAAFHLVCFDSRLPSIRCGFMSSLHPLLSSLIGFVASAIPPSTPCPRSLMSQAQSPQSSVADQETVAAQRKQQEDLKTMKHKADRTLMQVEPGTLPAD